MKQTLKLFFDECCSKRLSHTISETCSTNYLVVQTKHLSEFCRRGKPDEEWLPLLEKQRDWIVVTADRGKDPKKQKLPRICAALGITHISLTPALIKQGYQAHETAFRSVFPQIVNAPLIPKGTKISLGFKWIKKHSEKVFWLSIEQTDFDTWCLKKGITLPSEHKPN